MQMLEKIIKELILTTTITTLFSCATTKPEYNPIRERLPKTVPDQMIEQITDYNYEDSCGTKKKIMKYYGKYYTITVDSTKPYKPKK